MGLVVERSLATVLLFLCLAPLDCAWRPRQWPTVFRMLPTCASMWAIRPLVMS
jgi:hypothetical protein